VNIHDAARRSDLTAIQALLRDDSSALLDRDKAGNTPLHVAIKKGSMDVIEFLLSHGSNVNARDNNGATPLHTAVWNNRHEGAGLLLSNGADVNARNDLGETPLSYARMRGNWDIASLLLANIAKVNLRTNGLVESPLADGGLDNNETAKTAEVTASKANSLTSAQAWVANGIVLLALVGIPAAVIRIWDVDSDSKSSSIYRLSISIFAFALWWNVLKVLRFLNANDPAIATSGSNGTPLHAACANGDRPLVESLLAANADVNAGDESGSRPLHWAAFSGHAGIVELLLTNRADVNVKSSNGWTPLHSAAASGHKEVAALLLANGADINAKGKHGETPWRVASSNHRGADFLGLLQRDGGHK